MAPLTRSERPQRARVDAPYHVWTGPSEASAIAFYRSGNAFLVRFPNVTDFEIAADGLSVLCWSVPGVSQGTVDYIYENQVVPLALSQQGKLVFHASAVQTSHGAAAFMGESGQGKSTLAAALCNLGSPLLADDGLVLETDTAGGTT